MHRHHDMETCFEHGEDILVIYNRYPYNKCPVCKMLEGLIEKHTDEIKKLKEQHENELDDMRIESMGEDA